MTHGQGAAATPALPALAGPAAARAKLAVESRRSEDQAVWDEGLPPAFEERHPDIDVEFPPTAPAESTTPRSTPGSKGAPRATSSADGPSSAAPGWTPSWPAREAAGSPSGSAGFRVGGSEIAAPPPAGGVEPGAPVTSGARPEHARLAEPGAAPLAGEVLEPLGGETPLHVDLGGAEPLVAEVGGAAPVRPGDRVGLVLPPEAPHLFDARGAALPRGEA